MQAVEELAAHRPLSGVSAVGEPMRCRPLRRLLWRPHCLLLPVGICPPAGPDALDCGGQCGCRLQLLCRCCRWLWTSCCGAGGSSISSNRLPGSWPFLLLKHLVDLLLVLRLGIKSGLSESRHCILMVSRGNQFLSFLEMLLCTFSQFLFLFRLPWRFASFAALLSEAAFSVCASNCAMLVISPVAFCTGSDGLQESVSSSCGTPLRVNGIMWFWASSFSPFDFGSTDTAICPFALRMTECRVDSLLSSSG